MMEDEDSSFVSNTDATICNTDDLCSSWGFSLISDPNIKASSSTTVDDPRQPQISTAATTATDYDLTESGASSSRPSMHAEKVIRIFNVDFSQFSGVVVCNDTNNKEEEKRSESTRLVKTLMFCAEAVQQNNQTLADALIGDIRALLAIQQSSAMKKVATYFTEALDRRIHGIRNLGDIVEYSDYRNNFLQMHFYETFPYLKFAHFTANQAIHEAFANSSRVHVIDLSFKNGLQWPALMQALALRPGGPPSFRLTGIAPDNAYDNIQEVGMKLTALAKTIGVTFAFRGFVADSLADVDALMWDFRRRNEETVAVNCVFELHHVLSTPGAIEKVLNSIREMQPKIVTIAEAEANHNGSVFLDRFNEAWHYYSTMFESLENSELTSNNSQQFAEHYLRWQINNVVACEGTERVERHETLSQWRVRMNSSGFNPLHLGYNAFKQARLLMALLESRNGYSVEMNNGTLMLSWHSRQHIASSAWRPV